MALTVEELQIVLSCDASTAQDVLKKMDATVKAYTDKFQKYFDKLGKQNKSSDSFGFDTKAIEKQLDNVTKAISSKGKDWKKQYEKTFNESFEASMEKAKKGNHGEYVPSGDKTVGMSFGGVYDPDYYQKSIAEYEAMFGKVAEASGAATAEIQKNIASWVPGGGGDALFNLAENVTSTLQNSMGGVDKIPETLRYKIESIIGTVNSLGEAYRKALDANGAEDKGTIALQKKFETAVFAADGYIKKLDEIAYKEQESGQNASDVGVAPSRLSKILGMIMSIRGAASSAGASIKKAFSATILGKFLKQLGRTMLRMAAMKLIRGTIQGIKDGLEMLSKAGGSAGKAMNSIKASTNAVKASLGVALMPVVKALAPLFYRLASAVAQAGNIIARFFAVLTGQSSYTAAVISDNMDDVSESVGGAGSAVKGVLADFDEINLLTKQSGGGGGGGGADSGYASFIEQQLEASGGIAKMIRESFTNADWEGLGTILGDGINSIFSPEMFQNIGTNLGEKINSLFTTTYWTLNTINFENIGASIASLLNGAISQIDFSNLGGIIATRFTALPGIIIGAVNTLDFGAVGNALSEIVHGFITTITDFIAETDWGEFVWNAINGIFDFIAGLDIPSIALDILGFIGTVIGSVAEGLGTLMIDLAEVVTNPDTWTLVGAWLKDLPARLKNFGIKAVNGFVQPIIDGINDIINKYNGSALADLFGEIEPISFNLIPEIPDEELNKNYNKAKAEIEARSKENPTVFDSTANYTDWSVDGSKDKSKVSHFTTWNSTAQWNYQKTGSKWGGTTWNSTAQWNYQKIGPKWGGTTWNSTALFKSYSVDDALKSNGYMRISATADIKKVTGSSVNITAAANGGLLKNGTWRPIASYARGGSPFGGQIFRARENGNPELVGTINGSTAVMNNGQIVASVSAGVARAIAGIRFKLTGMNTSPIVNAVDPDISYANTAANMEAANSLSKIQQSVAFDKRDSITGEQATTIINLLRGIEKKELSIKPSIGLAQVVQQSNVAYSRT